MLVFPVTGPGLKVSQSHRQRRAPPQAYAVVDKSAQRQSKRQSFSRASRVPSKHPHLPTSGAKRVARQSSSDLNQDFMNTPESGVCGYVYYIFLDYEPIKFIQLVL